MYVGMYAPTYLPTNQVLMYTCMHLPTNQPASSSSSLIQGYYCTDGTGRSQQRRAICPVNFFCPTGTANPYVGAMASDSLARGLSATEADPFLNQIHLKVGRGSEIHR